MKRVLIAYIVFILILAILPLNGKNSILNNNYLLDIRWDYLVHAMIFVPLFPLMLYAKKRNRTYKQIIILLLISFFVAFSSEFIQYFISYRAFNINDLLANGIGVTIGVIITLIRALWI